MAVLQIVEKQGYMYGNITVNQSNPKQLWEVIGQLTDKKHNDAIPADLCANGFNSYLSNVGANTVSHLKSSDNVSDVDGNFFWRGSHCISIFYFSEIKQKSVRKQLHALGTSSNNDVLGFDSRLLCICSNILAPIITKFANESIKTNCVLDDWKLSRVTPIYKGKGDVNEMGIYRPISVISHIAKIIERR